MAQSAMSKHKTHSTKHIAQNSYRGLINVGNILGYSKGINAQINVLHGFQDSRKYIALDFDNVHLVVYRLRLKWLGLAQLARRES